MNLVALTFEYMCRTVLEETQHIPLPLPLANMDFDDDYDGKISYPSFTTRSQGSSPHVKNTVVKIVKTYYNQENRVGPSAYISGVRR